VTIIWIEPKNTSNIMTYRFQNLAS